MPQRTHHIRLRRMGVNVKVTWTNLWPQPFGAELKVQCVPRGPVARSVGHGRTAPYRRSR